MAAFVTSKEGSISILEVTGRLDPQDGSKLRETLDHLSTESTGIVVDLQGLEFMASAGFRELFLTGRKLDSRGARLAVCGLQGEVKRVFELARFETAYPIHEDRVTAMATMQKVS